MISVVVVVKYWSSSSSYSCGVISMVGAVSSSVMLSGVVLVDGTWDGDVVLSFVWV